MATKLKVYTHYAVCSHDDKLHAEPFLSPRNDVWTSTPSAGGEILDFELDADDSRFLAVVQVDKDTFIKQIGWVRGNFNRNGWGIVKRLT